jgi:hypothetical protein
LNIAVILHHCSKILNFKIKKKKKQQQNKTRKCLGNHQFSLLIQQLIKFLKNLIFIIIIIIYENIDSDNKYL